MIRWKIHKTTTHPGTTEHPWVVTQLIDGWSSSIVRCSDWTHAWSVVERAMRVVRWMGFR